jgi:hypothetical protein
MPSPGSRSESCLADARRAAALDHGGDTVAAASAAAAKAYIERPRLMGVRGSGDGTAAGGTVVWSPSSSTSSPPLCTSGSEDAQAALKLRVALASPPDVAATAASSGAAASERKVVAVAILPRPAQWSVSPSASSMSSHRTRPHDATECP